MFHLTCSSRNRFSSSCTSSNEMEPSITTSSLTPSSKLSRESQGSTMMCDDAAIPPAPPIPPLTSPVRGPVEEVLSRGVHPCALQAERMRQKEMQFKMVGAIENNNLDLLSSLIEKGVDVNAIVQLYLTPLLLALRCDRQEAAHLLIAAGCDVNQAEDSQYKTRPIHMIALKNQAPVLRELLLHGADRDIKDCRGSTALHIAAQQGHAEIVRLLLENGADVCAQNQLLCSPLHLACSEEIMEMLLHHGADMEQRDRYGRTPLFSATINEKRTQYLVNRGCCVNVLDCQGMTPLHYAARFPASITAGNLPVIRTLVNSGSALDAHHDPLANPMFPLLGFIVTYDLPLQPVVKYLFHAGAHIYKTLCECSFYESYGLLGHRDRLGFLMPLFDDQMKLSVMCRKVIRQSLSATRDISGSIQLLPIPSPLKNFLNECELKVDQDL